MNVIPYLPEHLAALRIQQAQAYMEPLMRSPDYARELSAGDARTWTHGGDVVGIGGVVPIWPGRACAWALVSAGAGRCMTALTRSAGAFLSASGVRRLEAYVDPDFHAAHRWMRMLGFTLEARMSAFKPDGSPALLYARIG